ncbi:MAG: hypothetical protein Q8Q36_03280 [bacterium]|nr:hypothetical protein [bacterium]
MTRTRKILFSVLALVAAFFVYSFFLKSGPPTSPLVSETPLLSAQDVKGRELLTVLLSLNNIRLDEEVFSSPLFENLQDFSVILPDSGVTGRGNPFAPIGVEEPAAQ